MLEQGRIELELKKYETREKLMVELTEVIDINNVNFPIDFVSTEYYTIDENFKPEAYTPEHHYLIEGNNDSREIIIPKNVYRITSMLRPQRKSMMAYFKLLEQLGCRKVFIQPFVTMNGDLRIFKPSSQGGGVIIRIGDIKRSELMV